MLSSERISEPQTNVGSYLSVTFQSPDQLGKEESFTGYCIQADEEFFVFKYEESEGFDEKNLLRMQTLNVQVAEAAVKPFEMHFQYMDDRSHAISDLLFILEKELDKIEGGVENLEFKYKKGALQEYKYSLGGTERVLVTKTGTSDEEQIFFSNQENPDEV